MNRNSKNRKGIKIEWSEVMLEIIRTKFSSEFNRYIAVELGISMRSVIRKAREFDIFKQPKFLEFRRMEISAMAQAAKPENINKGNKGWCVPNSENTRFKPGHISPMYLPAVRKKVSNSRLNRIADEKLRIELGLPQLTKLKLKV